MKKKKLHRNEKELIRILFKEGRPLTIYELSDLSDISWITVKKYLKMLVEKKVIEVIGKPRKRFVLKKDLINALIEMKRE